MCRFALPHTIFDNGTNIVSKQIASFCAKYKITYRFSTFYYPQSNGQTKIINRTILDKLCKSLDKVKGKLVEKLSGVLWTYETTKRISTSATPFSLAYRTEAIIPVDISMTLRVEGVVQNQNDALLRLMLIT